MKAIRCQWCDQLHRATETRGVYQAECPIARATLVASESDRRLFVAYCPVQETDVYATADRVVKLP